MYSEKKEIIYRCSVQSKILHYEHKDQSNCEFIREGQNETRRYQVTENSSFQYLTWKIKFSIKCLIQLVIYRYLLPCFFSQVTF